MILWMNGIPLQRVWLHHDLRADILARKIENIDAIQLYNLPQEEVENMYKL